MSIKVTFEFETAEDAANFLLDRDDNPVDMGVGSAGTKAKRGRPRKEAPAVVEGFPPKQLLSVPASPPIAVAPSTPAAIATAPAAAATAVPFSALVEPLTALADKDLEAAMAILAKYGVKTARELKPEQFGPVLAEVTAALTPTPAARPSLI